MPGQEGAVPADGLQLQDQEEQHGAEGGVDEQRHRVGGAERAVGEHARAASSGARRAARPSGSPPPSTTPTTAAHTRQRVAPLDEGVGDAAERDRRQRRADDVEPCRARRGRGSRAPHRWAMTTVSDGEREVDQEDPAPGGVLHQRAADERADRRGDAAEARPRADGAGPALAARRRPGSSPGCRASASRRRCPGGCGRRSARWPTGRCRTAARPARTRPCRPRRSGAGRSGRRASRRAGSAPTCVSR